MGSLKEKINLRLDILQDWMESNHHLEAPGKVMDLTLEISKFWSVLNEEDKDYVQCAQHAIEEQTIWEVH